MKKLTNPILRPSRIIHKIGEDELCVLMRIGLRRYRDQNDQEREQRCREGDIGDPRQPFGVAIPDECEIIDGQIADINVPGLNRAAHKSQYKFQQRFFRRRVYNSG